MKERLWCVKYILKAAGGQQCSASLYVLKVIVTLYESSNLRFVYHDT